MARVFISHAGADTCWAKQVHGWLDDNGHEAFFDRDVDDGVLPGEEWQNRLYAELRKADAVVCIVTEHYLGSVWCAAEIGAARVLGTELLPVRFGSSLVRHPLLAPIHDVDGAADASDAYERLRKRLSAIDGGGGWGWPDGESPYPGLHPFELDKHRVFFGRGQEITEIADRLRSPERATPKILTVVGPSGCGKSSLIRAGVLPRINGERYWLAGEPIVPGTDPLYEVVRAVAEITRKRQIPFDVTSLRSDVDRDGLKEIVTNLLNVAGADSQCKLLIVIDQFEELLTRTPAAQRAEFVSALDGALGGPLQVLATLRRDFLDPVYKDPHLSQLERLTHEIRPLDSEALRSVIERPAKVAGLSFEEDLVTRLLTDTGTGHALPLLAFTLQQLARGARRGDQLTRQRYDEIGGVRGALQQKAKEALEDAVNTTGVTQEQILTALVDLVDVDEQGRRTKRLQALDNSVRDLFEPFITRRLVSTTADGAFVSVAHEAFLANWPPLTDAIEARADALRARYKVEDTAKGWDAGGRDDNSALLQGPQLAKATVDIGAELERVDKSAGSLSSDKRRRLTLPKWWPGDHRLVTRRVDLSEVGRAFLETSMRTDRTRRRRRTIQVAAVIAILAVAAVTAGVGFFQAKDERDKAQASARRAIASRLLNEATDMLAQKRPGGDVQALQEVVAAQALAPDTAAGGLFDAVINRRTTAKIADAGGAVLNVAFGPDGHLVALSDEQGSARLQDVDTGQTLGRVVLANTDDKITAKALAFSPDGHRLAIGRVDGTVQVWSADTGRPLGAPLTGHSKDVYHLAFSPDGHHLASASFDGTLRVWNVDTGQILGAPLTPSDITLGDPETGSSDMMELALGPDGHRLAVGTFDGAAQVWNVDTGRPLGAPVSGYKDTNTAAMAFSLDGRRLATGSLDGRLQLWNADTGQPVGAPLTGHIGQVRSVVFSPDGHRLASASDDKTVRLWDADTGQPLGAPFTGHTQMVTSVAFSPDGQRLASGSIVDQTVRLWQADADQPVKLGHADKVWAAAFSADRRLLATTADPEAPRIGVIETTVQVWEADTGQPVRTLRTEPMDSGLEVAISPDGRRLATGSFQGTVRLWNADTGQPLSGPLTGHTDTVTALAFSRDGHRLASASANGTVRLWNADPGQPLGDTLTHHTGSVPAEGRNALWVDSVAFSPDGNLLASAGRDGTVRLWNVDTRQPRGVPLTDDAGAAMSVAFSPDGHRLAVGHDLMARLWNVDTSQPIGAPLTGPTDFVTTLGFSPDGRLLAGGGHDNTVRLWDTETGQPIAGPLTGHTNDVLSVAFGPDGQRLFTVSRDGRLRIWPAVATPEMLCDKLTTNMSRKQWREWVSPDIDYVTLCPQLPVPPD